jgi:hypothetical protein
MAVFFHLDRINRLQEGMELGLHEYDVWPPEFSGVISSFHPEGLTPHGYGFLCERQLDQSTFFELLLETVRRHLFPDRPSRFQCVFALESLEQAQAYRVLFPSPGWTGTIWRVEADDSFRANLALLDFRVPAIAILSNAHAYWRGEQGLSPAFWEVLLRPPVRVLGRADE